jgi:nitroimidazol reductase NimA-like FMN-containing flavoprotein (pyridoxamine 5'-phosphate oxidase superfamily)
MTTERAPLHEEPMVDGQAGTTPWALARERLANPEPSRTSWLATVRPDGRPHLMPIIAFWIDGAFHFVVGEETRKGRNLAADGRCVVAIGSTTLPSLDVVVEGYAQPLDDEDAVARIAETLRGNTWPLEARGGHVYGPNAPTAGPPPYAIYRMVPSKAFGLPGMFGMEQFDQSELPKPTRWAFDGPDSDEAIPVISP